MEGMTLQDNAAAQRFELVANGSVVGVAAYRLSDKTVTITHTEIPDEHKGKGYGSELAKQVLDRLRTNQMKVIPACQFIASFIQKHPEYADLTTP